MAGSDVEVASWATRPLRPRPAASPRPWGGQRLGGTAIRIGESWLAGPDSIVETPQGSTTLGDIAARLGEPFVGARTVERLGARFPLLVKLIDAADWLSLQVHPDDDFARSHHGRTALGKAEAWLILDAELGSDLVVGPAAGLDPDRLRAGIASGDLGRDHCHVVPATPGDTWLLEPGTLHAIGAGTFVYEVEQPSDLTYRISDWGRAATAGRHLHTAESLATVRPDAVAARVGRDHRLDGGALVTPWFSLEIVDVGSGISRRPDGASVHVITAIDGTVLTTGPDWTEEIEPFETLVVPASIPAYDLTGRPGSRVCIGSIP